MARGQANIGRGLADWGSIGLKRILKPNLNVITHCIVTSLAVENECETETSKIRVFSEFYECNQIHYNFKMVTLAQILEVKLTYS